MNAPHRSRAELTEIIEHAVLWYTKIMRDGMSREDRREFLRWIRRTPAHAVELWRIAQLDGQFRKMKLAPRRLTAENDNVIDLTNFLTSNDSTVSHTTASSSEADTIEQRALSSTYLAHSQKQTRSIKWTLGVLSLIFLACALLGFFDTIPAAIFSVGLLGVFIVKDVVLRSRIVRGLFGNNASEARALIRFLVDCTETVDFNDRDGKRRRIFEIETDIDKLNKPLPIGAITE